MENNNREPFFKAVRREFRELKSFYISDEQARNLKRRTFIGRFIVTTFYLLKALYLRLNPIRRVLFLLALFFLFAIQTDYQSHHVNVSFNLSFWGGVLLMFLLLLELKDKLLIKDEIRAARAIQNALIPQKQPQIKGYDIYFYYRPMNEVGGDLLDHITLGRESHLLALADVSGKGLSAALLMSKLHGLVHAFVHDTPFDRLMSLLNQKFFYSIPKRSFASMLLLFLKENAPEVRIANAGHLPPFFWHKNNFTELHSGGMALGLTEKQDYATVALTLGEGDILFCYSDGLSEAFNAQREEFGEDRIKEILRRLVDKPAETIGKAMLHQAETFLGEKHFCDDLTMIVLKKV